MEPFMMESQAARTLVPHAAAGRRLLRRVGTVY